MNDEQYWMQRLDEYCKQLARESVKAKTVSVYRNVTRLWIDYCLERGHDPSPNDHDVVERFLDSRDGIAETTRSTYTSDLRRWFNYMNESSSQFDVETWMQRLEAYIKWRSEVGGRSGAGAMRPTQENLRSILGRWARYACKNRIDPATYDEAAIAQFCHEQGGIKESTRGDYRRHIRRWCERLPEFERARPERLPKLFAEFRRSRYPTPDDEESKLARERFQRILESLPSLAFEDRGQLKQVWSRGKNTYGSPGQVVHLNSYLNQASSAQWVELRDLLTGLCFGGGDLASRIDTAMSQKGIGSATATRLAAICHPERFIPNYVLARSSSDNWRGKLEMIELVDELGLLDVAGTREAQEIHLLHREHGGSGAVVMRANDLLLESLRPYFTDDDVVDTWGIRTFLYWLEENYGDSTETVDQWIDDEDLVKLADELLCEVDFLQDILALLDDKGQVILYGPPGTGKTYFARSLAVRLALYEDEGDDAYSLVQFHPAYSYEDFFEGFRPRIDDNGQMTYELTPGPLIRLAQRAEEHPDELHVMVIDEINRANLPRVLGELLYLLEYRDEEIQTQYRPDDTFSLPSNLWFIGTMNTADRSIALIDAAMRRRFHFVPFFPNHGPTAGLLRRWMQRNSPEQEWVAGLVDKVNRDLAEQMGGDHSLIGPSHFMKSDLDKESLRRIWEYNIEPLIEDQLFGRQEAIESFRFGSVWRRYGSGATSSGAPPAEPDDQPPDPADEAGNLAGESEGAVDKGDA